MFQRRADEFYLKHWEQVRQGSSEAILEWSQLLNQYKHLCPDETSLQLLVTELQKSKKVSVILTENKEKVCTCKGYLKV